LPSDGSAIVEKDRRGLAQAAVADGVILAMSHQRGGSPSSLGENYAEFAGIATSSPLQLAAKTQQ
jgi:hypothetical protein